MTMADDAPKKRASRKRGRPTDDSQTLGGTTSTTAIAVYEPPDASNARIVSAGQTLSLFDEEYLLSLANSNIASQPAFAAADFGLGLPGQIDGYATLQSDRGDETQSLFRYQWCAGVTTLLAALSNSEASNDNPYTAVWCEHHDDLLGELPDDTFHAIQVKTKVNATPWKCTDSGFVQAIRKFCLNEALYSSKITRYIFFSNAQVYVPGSNAEKPATFANSPFRVAQACSRASCPESIPTPYKASFDGIVAAAVVDAHIAFRVFRKLWFKTGPALESYREAMQFALAGVPLCSGLPVEQLRTISDDLLSMVGGASSMEITALDFYSSVVLSDGRPANYIRSKRIAVDSIKILLTESKSVGFRYADVGGMVDLGNAKGQKNKLKEKMSAGYVGNFFRYIWLQALAAEEKLLEEAHVAPEVTLKKLKQLEQVMLATCQAAELKAALEPDDKKRGILILQGLDERAETLVRVDSKTVENERKETLMGIAGLLSGSCHFAWGCPIDGGDDDL